MQLTHDGFMVAGDYGDQPFPHLLLPTLISLGSGSQCSTPLLSINIPLGRPELMMSLGAEMPPNAPGRQKAG